MKIYNRGVRLSSLVSSSVNDLFTLCLRLGWGFSVSGDDLDMLVVEVPSKDTGLWEIVLGGLV